MLKSWILHQLAYGKVRNPLGGLMSLPYEILLLETIIYRITDNTRQNFLPGNMIIRLPLPRKQSVPRCL